MDDIESDPRNKVIKIKGKGLCTEHYGHLSWGKPRPNSKGQKAKAEDKENST